MGEKTEKATPKKLRDARKKGQVAKAQDLPSAFTFIVSIWVILQSTHFFYSYLGSFLINTFRQVADTNLNTIIPQLFNEAAIVIFITSIPVLGFVAMMGVIVNFLVVGPVFSFEVFKFDIKKFDPVQNLKAKFKLKTLVELLKSVVKISIACYIIYSVMYSSLPVLVKTVSLPLSSALIILYKFLLEVVIKVGLFFIIIAVADYVYQKRNFAKEMKMEKFEIKQEYKNSEGDPQIKGKRKQIAQEIAYQEGPGGGVKRAQAVVTNPTHLAIALGYDPEIDIAPYVIAMGKEGLAERMIKIAGQYNIPVVRNIALAHELWDSGEVYEYVPEKLYGPVAGILKWLKALPTEEAYQYEEEN